MLKKKKNLEIYKYMKNYVDRELASWNNEIKGQFCFLNVLRHELLFSLETETKSCSLLRSFNILHLSPYLPHGANSFIKLYLYNAFEAACACFS